MRIELLLIRKLPFTCPLVLCVKCQNTVNAFRIIVCIFLGCFPFNQWKFKASLHICQMGKYELRKASFGSTHVDWLALNVLFRQHCFKSTQKKTTENEGTVLFPFCIGIVTIVFISNRHKHRLENPMRNFRSHYRLFFFLCLLQ